MNNKPRATITGDSYMLNYREHNGCPKCRAQLVSRNRFHEDDEGYTSYGGRFLACPNNCRSVNGTPYTISLPNDRGVVYETNIGQTDFRNPKAVKSPAIVKRSRTGEIRKLR